MQGPGINRSKFYDANGERLVVRDGSSLFTFTLRDLAQQVVREVSWSAASGWRWGKDYVYRDGVLLASHSLADGLRYHFGDHLASPRLVANRCGERVLEHRTNPFGLDLPSGSSQSPDRMRFTMHERDLGSLSTTLDDLDGMHARTYWPSLGRFTSVDPGRDYDFSRPQSFNLYTYVRDNPVNSVDPDGKMMIRRYRGMADIEGAPLLYEVQFEDYGYLASRIGTAVGGMAFRPLRLLKWGGEAARISEDPWVRTGTADVPYLRNPLRKAAFEKNVFKAFSAQGAKEAAGLGVLDFPGKERVCSKETLMLLDKAVERVVMDLVKKGRITAEEGERIRGAYAAAHMLRKVEESKKSPR